MAMLQASLEYSCEVWTTNKFQAKTLESIQLHACKYIFECSVATYELLHAHSELKTWKTWYYFCKVKLYCKVMCMNAERLPFK